MQDDESRFGGPRILPPVLMFRKKLSEDGQFGGVHERLANITQVADLPARKNLVRYLRPAALLLRIRVESGAR